MDVCLGLYPPFYPPIGVGTYWNLLEHKTTVTSIKTNKNIIWLFKSNKDLVLEESVHIDRNDVKETKQIVIKGITKKNREQVEWSLIKK